MHSDLAHSFKFNSETDTGFIRHEALNGRIQFVLKQNPNAEIFHTQQVALNGFIYSNLSGTRATKKSDFTYFGKPAYQEYILTEPETIRENP